MAERDLDQTTVAAPAKDPATAGKPLFGVAPIKWVFGFEYVLQGLANPFQGITYQPFFRHFRVDYGLSEAATQGLFAKSYLAWSFKPIIGFLMDAYGRTRTALTLLLATAVAVYLLTPILDTSATVFFGLMFGLSVVLAATDVAVDRATVITGEEEAQATGRSKSTTVGLNQAICWAAIYGTGIVAAVSGGWVADNLPFDALMPILAVMPLIVLLVVLRLPKDKAVSVPVTRSVKRFWHGLNSGPILWIILFYFIFHFQPAMGALWNNYLIEDLGFSQTQIGLSDGAGYAGYFVGVLIFATAGIRWQDRFGLKRLFRIFIVLSVLVNLAQYAMVDPWFSRIAGSVQGLLPFLGTDAARVGTLATFMFLQTTFVGVVRMSTFSLVGAVIPSNAAGSLFAGFMSVANLAYSFSYASGAWLYQNGLEFDFVRNAQQAIFGIPGLAGDSLSIKMLILIGSLAYLLSFVATHRLPDKRETTATSEDELGYAGPERWQALGGRLRTIDIASLVAFAAVLAVTIGVWGFDVISATLLAFFGVTFVRKVTLDAMTRGESG